VDRIQVDDFIAVAGIGEAGAVPVEHRMTERLRVVDERRP
jgi:hypothetical protein